MGLTEAGQKIIIPIIRVLFQELEVRFVAENIMLEIRFKKPHPKPESSQESN